MDFEYNEEQKDVIRNVKEVSEEFKDVFYKANHENEHYSAEDGARLRQACDQPEPWEWQKELLILPSTGHKKGGNSGNHHVSFR
ncbi:hypothetical protein ACFLWI_05690 [Chloroflexota bacterium]